MKIIDSFSGPNRYLSNFYPCKNGVAFMGQYYPTSEHAYAASKTYDEDIREAIRNAPTPRDAKALGRTAPLHPDWEKSKFYFMESIVRQKFLGDRALRYPLVESTGTLLVEGNSWHDNIWGDCSCVKCKDVPGQNALGIILMRVRLEMMDVA
ncbi:hypothetical protein SEA_FORZA_23 [Gordonia phage Forza]|uniref:NADAR domain-containing protein n=1 Tax=Gordonia phage Forza TaxID=2571247 RepID=A0A650EXY6_9CAUD|nr:hypothetical protein PP303_gp023 [Gordonia phage Forza]QEM41492.1 hypothetical protein SEA_BOOPY_23 [Gordonia phage Boopy]QGT55016.1 hypothetical protein SEA_FORZA_23 [Gordonia phage Forza]UXE04165.1 hypothetical protein SEA_BLUENGOLD_21 [Gordonia phage BlueNGold]WBF03804.1 hypothetical protein SEA_MAREELIH_21 [Gordonia phage Mareelih]